MKNSIRDVSYLTIANIIVKVLAIGSLIIFTRFLSKSELAAIPVFNLLSRLSMVVFSMGILPCTIKELPVLKENEEYGEIVRFTRTSLLIVVPGIVCFAVLCYTFSDFVAAAIIKSPSFSTYLKWMSIGILFSGLNQLFKYFFWGLSLFKEESYIEVGAGFIKIILGIILVINIGILGLIISLVIVAFIQFLASVYFLRDVIFKRTSLYSIRKLLQQSWPFYLESYLMYFRGEGDQLIVTSILGAEALGIYYVAKRPFELTFTFIRSLDKVLTASLAKLKTNLESFKKRVQRIIELNSYLLMPFIFFLITLTPMLIIIIAGSDYGDAIFPAIILLITLLVQFTWQSTFGRIIFFLNPSLSRLKMTLIETVLLLIFILPLGKWIGIQGIVFGRLFATTIAGAIAYKLTSGLSLNLPRGNIIFIFLLVSILTAAGLLVYIQIPGIITTMSLSLGWLIIYFVIIHYTISKSYYDTLNTIFPKRITDPVNILIGRILG